MAHLTSEDYSRRNENSAKRMVSNKSIDSLTSEQHDAISMLCTARHELHSNKSHAIIEDYKGLKQAIIASNITILESGIEPMNFVGTDSSDYIDIDSLNELDYEEEDYDSEYERISSELEELNSKIENYLLEIDNKYNTNYAPTGAQRIF